VADLVTAESEITELLGRVRRGEAEAKALLVPRVYAELRALAGSYFRGRVAQTLQPTALVHEVYLRLVRADGTEWKDRAHFMAVAATAMRQILTDRARRRVAAKRGGADRERVTLSNVAAFTPAVDVIALDDLLVRLAALDERQARLVELRFFGGLTEEEAAETMGVSLRTVQKDWRKAKAWLLAELEEKTDAPGGALENR
jgi:RNA polymerase sigma factor (TIGR02999 family)